MIDIWESLLYTTHYGSYLGESGNRDAFHTLLKVLADRKWRSYHCLQRNDLVQD